MDLDTAVDFARTTRQSVLTTVRRNGRPQLSNVLHHVTDDGVVKISITADRAKYRNLVREPWAALHVSRDDFFAYVVLESDVDLTPVSASPGDATVAELVDLYRSLAGEHEDWDAYRSAMVAERRVVVRLRPGRAYGMLDLPPRSGS
jgi:PPOX class probable F420-dependent enzyme